MELNSREKKKKIQLCLCSLGYFFYCFKRKCIHCSFSETLEETNTEITGALKDAQALPTAAVGAAPGHSPPVPTSCNQQAQLLEFTSPKATVISKILLIL